MKKTVTKIIALAVVLFTCLGILSACVDYGYEFHFSVVGENGIILHKLWSNTSNKWIEKGSPVKLLGNKNGQQLEITAVPNDGYRVKEWICNGEIIEGNKTNTFIAISPDFKHNIVVITVEFELIPSED